MPRQELTFPTTTPDLPNGRHLLFAYGTLMSAVNTPETSVRAWVRGFGKEYHHGYPTLLEQEESETVGALVVVDEPTLRCFDIYEGLREIEDEGLYCRRIITTIWNTSYSTHVCPAYVYMQKPDSTGHITQEEIAEIQEGYYTDRDGVDTPVHPFNLE